MGTLDTIQDLLTAKEIDRKNAFKSKKEAQVKVDYYTKQLEVFQEVLQVFQAAVQQTQSLLSDSLSSIVSTALSSLFADPYTFVTDFVQRRNSTECDLLFERNECRMQPLKECGYGAVDTAAIAARISIWGMEEDSAPIIILDEPWRNLDKKKHSLASAMLKKLSEELNIQFIIITHSPSLAECADKVFEVTMKDKLSYIEEIM